MRLFNRKSSAQPNQSRRREPVAEKRSSVFSYYATSSGERRNRLPGEERTLRPTETVQLHSDRDAWLRNIPLLLAVGAVVIGIIYNTTLSREPQVIVHSVTAEQTYLRDKATYQNALQEEFGSSLLYSSKLTIDTQAIADAMMTRFPELADVSVTLPLLGRHPVVQLDATQPALLLVSGDTNYVLDQRGIALMDARELKSAKPLLIVRDQSSLVIEKGKPALTRDQVAFILELHRQLDAKKLKIKEIVLPAQAQQVDIYFSDLPYYGKFLFLTDSRVVAGGFLALHNDLRNRNITPRQYIDARLEERLYYK